LHSYDHRSSLTHPRSIIIGNFSARTGAAFLTQPQREWIDLKRLISRQRPSKRPKVRPTSAFRAWCFDRAVHKRGWWSRVMTFLYVLHVFALMTQSYAASSVTDDVRSTSLILCSPFDTSRLTRCRRLLLGNLWRGHLGCRYPWLRAWVAQFSREWLEYLRCSCGLGQLDHDTCGSILVQGGRLYYSTKIVHRGDRLQACPTSRQLEQVIQDGNVRTIVDLRSSRLILVPVRVSPLSSV